MARKKTSLNIDEDLWRDFNIHVLKKHGTQRRVSDEIERIIKEEMETRKD